MTVRELLNFINEKMKGRHIICLNCEAKFREDKLKELHDGTVYVEAVVCPNCNSVEWEYLEATYK